MSLHVTLDAFEGPLDLLLHLISRARIDIRDIFVSQITEQYLEMMRDVGSLEMDAASEFLQMAAQLLEIKSRALLPRPPQPADEDEIEDPEQALIRRLREYKAFKEVSLALRGMESGMSAMLTKLPEELVFDPPEVVLTGFSLDGLGRAFLRVMRRAQERELIDHIDTREIRRETFSVRDRIAAIGDRLRACQSTSFDDLFDPAASRDEVIVTFLAILEMLKMGRLSVSQQTPFGELRLSMREGGGHERDDDPDAFTYR